MEAGPTGGEEEVPTILVIDGGFSSQLSCHVGNVDGSPLWSARFLQTHPEAIVNTHMDFLRAGADVIITNTYQAWVNGFVKYCGVTPEEGRGLIVRAVELAKQARDSYLEECGDNIQQESTPVIAGSVGPYGAHLCNFSEYDGSYGNTTSMETMSNWHKPRIEALIDAGVDIIAFETIPCVKEAKMLVELLKQYPSMKAWLSFSCNDEGKLANGEDFKSAAVLCWEANPKQLLAVGVNCCSPLIIAKLLEGINNNRSEAIPFVVYPNSGESYNPQIGWIDRDKREALEQFVDSWLDLGVRYIGGCCRTYGADISCIRIKVQSWCDRKRYKNLHLVLDSDERCN